MSFFKVKLQFSHHSQLHAGKCVYIVNFSLALSRSSTLRVDVDAQISSYCSWIGGLVFHSFTYLFKIVSIDGFLILCKGEKLLCTALCSCTWLLQIFHVTVFISNYKFFYSSFDSATMANFVQESAYTLSNSHEHSAVVQPRFYSNESS